MMIQKKGLWILLCLGTYIYGMKLDHISYDVAYCYIQKGLTFQDIGHLKQVSRGCNSLYDQRKICPHFNNLICNTYACSRLAKNYYACTKALAHFADKKSKRPGEDEKIFQHLWQYHKDIRDRSVMKILKQTFLTSNLKDQMQVYQRYTHNNRKIVQHIIDYGHNLLVQKNIPSASILFSCGSLNIFDLLHRICKDDLLLFYTYLGDIWSNAVTLSNIDLIKILGGGTVDERSFEYIMEYATAPFIITLLQNNILPIDIRDRQEKTILHYAAQHGYEDVIKFALQNGAYVNWCDNKDMTPLHYAMKYGKARAALELFLDIQANLHFKDKKGKKPLDYIKKSRLDDPEVKSGKKEIAILFKPFIEKKKSNNDKIYRNGYQKLQ
ncbi:MAG TPA: ankyrin repeat domain-containing protein [Candidatus Babeliales bacterium]|nr:ankyrin repeat domain-containing protein [Candidatus Babeliales bacterium]